MSTQEQIEKRLETLEAKLELLESRFPSAAAAITDVRKKKLSLREFMNSKAITSEVQKTLAIGYYLETHEALSSFNIQDIKKGFNLAKEPAPRNINDTINKNIQKGFLMETDEKKEGTKAWMLTNSGIEFIDGGFKTK